MIFFIWLSCLVAPYNNMSKIFRLGNDFLIFLYQATKQLSRIKKKIIDFHHQFFKHYQTPSALMFKSIFTFQTWTPILYTYSMFFILPYQNPYQLPLKVGRGRSHAPSSSLWDSTTTKPGIFTLAAVDTSRYSHSCI